jgi:hypothetical protein
LPDVISALPTPEQVLWAYWDHVQRRVFGCPGPAAGGEGAPPPTASPEETVAADASLRPGVCLVEAYSPVLKELHQELFRQGKYPPVDWAVFFLCTRNEQLTVDAAYKLLDDLDGEAWAIYESAEHGTVLVPLWNL